jgi:hypothetical protein
MTTWVQVIYVLAFLDNHGFWNLDIKENPPVTFYAFADKADCEAALKDHPEPLGAKCIAFRATIPPTPGACEVEIKRPNSIYYDVCRAAMGGRRR